MEANSPPSENQLEAISGAAEVRWTPISKRYHPSVAGRRANELSIHCPVVSFLGGERCVCHI